MIYNCKHYTIKTALVFLTILPTWVLMKALTKGGYIYSSISVVFGYYLLLWWVCTVWWFSILCCMFCYWKRPFFVLKLIKRLQLFVICNVPVILVSIFNIKVWRIFFPILWTAGGKISLRKKNSLDSCICLLTFCFYLCYIWLISHTIAKILKVFLCYFFNVIMLFMLFFMLFLCYSLLITNGFLSYQNKI